MEAYILKHKDFKTRLLSRSGGFFTAISDYVLERNGSIYGVVLEEGVIAKHVRTTNPVDRDRMRGSKYIQSELGDCYKQVREDLSQGRIVLFTGTSCQIAGLNSYLESEYSDLITVDIICHGVPSPRVWRDYIQNLEEKYEQEIVGVDFRNKYKYGWAAHVETFVLKDGSKIDSKIFANLFYNHKILRPSCYKCPYKNLNRVSDFTVGDAWGVDQAIPEFNDDNGTSLVIVNTPKASTMFDELDMVEVKSVDINDFLQTPLLYPFHEPEDRKKFWKHYNRHSFQQVVNKHRTDVAVTKFFNTIRHKLGHSR